jgi:hypothetical protein
MEKESTIRYLNYYRSDKVDEHKKTDRRESLTEFMRLVRTFNSLLWWEKVGESG